MRNNTRMSICRHLESLLAAYVDRETSPEEDVVIEHHVKSCAACHDRVETQRAIRHLLRGRVAEARSQGISLSWRPRSDGIARSRAWRMVFVAAAVVPVAAVLLWAVRGPQFGLSPKRDTVRATASDASLSVGLQRAYAII